LELRRLRYDLVWCYTIVFGYVDVQIYDFLGLLFTASATPGQNVTISRCDFHSFVNVTWTCGTLFPQMLFV